MNAAGCRIIGCVAIGAPAPYRVSEIRLDGLCSTHQRFPADELRVLLKRKAGAVPPLQRVDVGIERERGDGTRYGIDHDGNYYDVPTPSPLPALPPSPPAEKKNE